MGILLLRFIFLFLLLPLATSSFAFADNSVGYDVSFPNCDQVSLFPKNEFAIIGVNNGKAFTKNPCLFTQYEQAFQNSAPFVALYMNLNAAIGSTALKSRTVVSPDIEVCANEKYCHAFNFGYNAAEYAYEYASLKGISSPIWWIDVELANSWFDDPLDNRKVINGAVTFFKGGLSPDGMVLIGKHINVGIYSTLSMWKNITGGWNINTPAWVGTDENMPPSFCPSSFTNPSQKAYLVQFNDPYIVLDKDILCTGIHK